VRDAKDTGAAVAIGAAIVFVVPYETGEVKPVVYVGDAYVAPYVTGAVAPYVAPYVGDAYVAPYVIGAAVTVGA
jgi:hypothetical protein